MKTLNDILHGVVYEWNGQGVLTGEVKSVQSDSRAVTQGDLFIAIPGFKINGTEFIPEAVRRGAVGIVSEKKPCDATLANIPFFQVQNARKAYGNIVSNFYGQPSRRLSLIGVTGTNGKTTISVLLHYLLNRFDKCGLIGTVFYDDGRVRQTATHTTPPPEVLNGLFYRMTAQGVRYGVMEVSSHALDQFRTEGIFFSGAVFSNLTQDHFDYHKGFEGYYQAKKKLFTGEPPPQFAVINADDPYGLRLSKEISGVKVIMYALHGESDYRALNLSVGARGADFTLACPQGAYQVETPLAFSYNISNVLAVLACVAELGFPLANAIAYLKDFPGVPGRMERVDAGQDFDVFVDYAHTPDAFQNVLSAVRKEAPARVLTVFGCGGDRDKAKRPQMGSLAEKFSDVVILTSDNPRTEDPCRIVDDIRRGMNLTDQSRQVEVIMDRRQAIQTALQIARKNDFVLVLGKGHEDYQIIGNEKVSFRDQTVILEFLNSQMRPKAPHG